MVAAGRWRATVPAVQRHAGFRLNALVSVLANASWGALAVEFVRAKDDSDELRVFVNTILAQGWREAAVEVDEHDLAARAEPFGLDAIPADVLVLSAGVDVQGDRLECSIVGWSRTEAFVLGHVVLWGSPDEDTTWAELDALLRTRWRHPGGGTLGVEAAIVDSGDRTDKVYAFTFPRLGRRIFAGKGQAGARPLVEPSHRKVRGGRLMLVGVDAIKSAVYDRLARGRALRFSHTLSAAWFQQVASERRVVRYSRGVPVARWERKPGAAAEALDCLVYAWAARHVVAINLDRRENELRQVIPPTAPPTSVASPFVAQW